MRRLLPDCCRVPCPCCSNEISWNGYTTSLPSSDIIAEDYWIQSADVCHMSLMSVSQALVSKLVDFTFLASLTTKKPKQQQQSEDKVYEYANQVLSLGLFYMEYLDTVHEGDGLRVQRCWRYLLLIFRATGRKNYSLKALYMLYASHFSLPRLSHQILWIRFVNTRGLSGHNIPCDLFLEYLNRLCKDAVTCLWSNQTEKAILRVSKAMCVLHHCLAINALLLPCYSSLLSITLIHSHSLVSSVALSQSPQ